MRHQKSRTWRQDIEKLFTEHPHQTGETYWQHLAFTLAMGLRIAGCGLLIMVHGLLPFLFTSTTSSQMKVIHAILRSRKQATLRANARKHD